MSEFQKRYNLTPQQMEALIKDGFLSCSIPFYEKVVYHYRESHSMQKTADHFNISKSEVHYIINRLK